FANFSALKLHLDGNWSDGYYTSEYDQMLTDSSFVVNARVALVDVPVNGTGTTMSFSLWARNLLDEQHLFYKINSAALGQSGIFNDPRISPENEASRIFYADKGVAEVKAALEGSKYILR
ncbi:hypothetical protein, partial [Pseudomonas syringae group genomosp. 7]|uniref:hypothetical protein n=1 Tax=Pseudomonas syringae group genomosp. 7 TaxID=251699 RepID=UPI00376F7796